MIVSKWKLPLLTFASSATLAGLLAYANVARAAYFFEHRDASYCTLTAGSTTANQYGCNTSTAGSIILACPVSDNTSLPKASYQTFNARVEDRTTSTILLSRCVNFFSATGVSCGGQVSSADGISYLNPPTFANWNTVNYGFIQVTIPPKVGASQSCIKGYTAEGGL